MALKRMGIWPSGEGSKGGTGQRGFDPVLHLAASCEGHIRVVLSKKNMALKSRKNSHTKSRGPLLKLLMALSWARPEAHHHYISLVNW